MWSNGPLFIWENWNILTLWTLWASTQSLQPHGCHGVLDVQQGQPIAQRGEWIGTEGSWTKSLATILGDICKKHDEQFLEDKLFWEIEVYLNSRFFCHTFLLASRGLSKITEVGHCSAQDNIPSVNFTTFKAPSNFNKNLGGSSLS